MAIRMTETASAAPAANPALRRSAAETVTVMVPPLTPEAPPPPKSKLRRRLLTVFLAAAAIGLLIAGVTWWLHARDFENTDDAFVDGHMTQIAPKIAGYVERLLVEDNQLVEQGQLLVQIDPRDYQVALDLAKAAEVSAQGRLREAQAQVGAAEAQAAAAKADVLAAAAMAHNAKQDLTRNNNLAPEGAVSRQTLDASVATAGATTAQHVSSEARALAAERQVELAKSQMVTASAAVAEAMVEIHKAELNLSYTGVYAPITGRVTHRTVSPGDYLQAGQPLFAMVDPNVWVTANFKETQLALMRPGQSVEVHVDAYPGRPLRAHVDSFQRGSGARFSLLPAENATGNYVKVVQRVPVKIIFDEALPDDMILGPGMSVEPSVKVR